jgi:hypothetical protein
MCENGSHGYYRCYRKSYQWYFENENMTDTQEAEEVQKQLDAVTARLQNLVQVAIKPFTRYMQSLGIWHVWIGTNYA